MQEARLPILYVLLVRWDDVCAHAIKAKVAWPVLQSKRDVFDEKFTAIIEELDVILKDRFVEDLTDAKYLFENRKDQLSLELQSEIKDLIGHVERKLKSTEKLCKSALVEKSYKIKTPTGTPSSSPSSSPKLLPGELTASLFIDTGAQDKLEGHLGYS